MIGFITDRSEENLNRRNALAAKGWDNMTAAERAEWTGNPLTAEAMGYTNPINLLPTGPYYSSSVELTYRITSITATATIDGSYQYAVAIVGAAADFSGKTLTLSLDSVVASGNAVPMVAAYWHDGNGFDWGGGSLSEAGTITFPVTENTNNREFLALYIYVATETAVTAGDMVRYNGLMLEEGEERHGYVPYMAILPTPATKGAYNYSDLNRVEMAVFELAEQLGLPLKTKMDWGLWDIPTQAEMDRYISNVVRIREALPNKNSIPSVPGRMNGLTLRTANRIEQILTEADAGVNAMLRTGDVFCGEV